jgi:serine/threonine protein kinase
MSTAPEPSIEILEEVDSGLYGRVFKGRQTALSRNVAVKIIKPEWPNAADAIKHARAIARAGAHPNIVTVYCVESVRVPGIEQPQTAMVMEWLEGEKLGIRLAGPLFSAPEVRRICEGLLDGVEHMHENGIAHGDLHVGNVILLSDCITKIIDIDANKEHSLARLSTISREGAVQRDIESCQGILFAVFSHGRYSIAMRNALDGELQHAGSLQELREIVGRALDGRINETASPAVSPTMPETAALLVEQFLPDHANKVAALLTKVQSNAMPLSQSIAEGLALARTIGSASLEDFCRNELLGWPPEPSPDASGSLAYRFVEMFVSTKVEINMQYRGWGDDASNVIDMMRTDPDNFTPVNMFIAYSVADVEQKCNETPDSRRNIGYMRTTMKVLVPSAKSDGPVFVYGRAEFNCVILSGIRREFTSHLIELLQTDMS